MKNGVFMRLIIYGKSSYGYKVLDTNFLDENKQYIPTQDHEFNYKFYNKKHFHKIIHDGKDFDFGLGADQLIVSDRALSILMKNFKLEFDVIITTGNSGERLNILIIKNLVNCLDSSSRIRTDASGNRIGVEIFGLKVNKDLCLNHDLFRLKEYPSFIICSDKFMKTMTDQLATAVDFREC